MKHPKIILFTKFSKGFTPSHGHIMKRSKDPYLQYLIMCCYTAKKNAEKYIWWFNWCPLPMCLLCPYKCTMKLLKRI